MWEAGVLCNSRIEIRKGLHGGEKSIYFNT